MEHSYRLFLDNIEHEIDQSMHEAITASRDIDIKLNDTLYRHQKEEIIVSPRQTHSKLYLTSTPRRHINISTKPIKKEI